jgi:hypothetical protein
MPFYYRGGMKRYINRERTRFPADATFFFCKAKKTAPGIQERASLLLTKTVVLVILNFFLLSPGTHAAFYVNYIRKSLLLQCFCRPAAAHAALAYKHRLPAFVQLV